MSGAMNCGGGTARYAVYYTPEVSHPLWKAGCEWLQRDPLREQAEPPTRAHVREPRRYGFHATLKPPMRLAAGHTAARLIEAVAQLARATPRFEMPTLSVQWLSGFLALQPAQPLAQTHPLHRLATACVTELDAWRAPPTAEELQRRLASPLDARQRELLARYGYPHVLERWRFHMTLTDTLPPDAALRGEVEREARAHFDAALQVPLGCQSLCVYVEPGPGQPLRVLQRCPLA